MLNFFKSKKFWLTVLHVATIAGGAYLSYSQGTPLPAVVSGGINALLASPLTNSPAQP